MPYRRKSSSFSSCLDSVEALFDTDIGLIDAEYDDNDDDGPRDGGNENAIFLVGHHLGDKGCKRIVNGLQDPCRDYYKLYLCDNRIGKLGSSYISELLKYNTTTLMELSLGNNHIGNEGAMQLSCALSVNNTLEMLNLERNDIGDHGVAALSSALEHDNNTLQWLVLSENPIGDGGASALLQCVGNTSSFGHLQRCNHSLLSIILKKVTQVIDTTVLRKINCYLKINRLSVSLARRAAQRKILMHVRDSPSTLLDYFATIQRSADVNMEMQCIVQVLALLGYQNDVSTSFVVIRNSPHLFSRDAAIAKARLGS